MESQWKKCFDCPCKDWLQRILQQFILWKMACSISRRMDADFGKSALVRIDRLKNSLAKRSTENSDKSAVAMLKITRKLGCVFHMEPLKSSSTLQKSSNIRKPIQRVKITKSIARHTKIRDQNPSLGMTCPGDPHQHDHQSSKFWGSVLGRDRLASARSPWSSVEADCKHPNTEEDKKPCNDNANDQQKKLEWCWNGYLDQIVQTCDSHNSQWRSADARRGNGVCQRDWMYILDYESPSKTRQQYCRLESFAMKTDILYEWINGQKRRLIKNRIRIQCNTENFVPILVPGLSTSSSSGSHPSTSKTPSSLGSNHPTSSSSSANSPTTIV